MVRVNYIDGDVLTSIRSDFFRVRNKFMYGSAVLVQRVSGVI